MSSPPRLAALLWDVDGTLAETERDGHRVAFNRAFEACGLPWRWDDSYYGTLLRVSGGFERLMHDMANRADAPASVEARAALARAIHTKKNAYYAELVRDGAIPLRHGVMALMRECREHRPHDGHYDHDESGERRRAAHGASRGTLARMVCDRRVRRGR